MAGSSVRSLSGGCFIAARGPQMRDGRTLVVRSIQTVMPARRGLAPPIALAVIARRRTQTAMAADRPLRRSEFRALHALSGT